MWRNVCLLTVVSGMVLMIGSGCATVVSGRDQAVSVRSTPEGVTVTAEDGTSVVAPGKLKLARRNNHTLTATFGDCEPQKREIKKELGGAVFGNILLGGVIGAGVDVASGAANKLVPSEVYFDFTEKGQAIARQQKEFIENHPEMKADIRFAIQNGLPVCGMTQDQLLACIGSPDTRREEGKYEILVYDSRQPKHYYLKNNVLERTTN